MHRHSETGDSLIETIIAIVIIGAIASALIGAIITNEDGTTSHRQLVTADHILRNYAENVKQTVRATCTAPGVVWAPTYTPPSGAGFTINSLSSNVRTCPSVTSIQAVALSVTLPNSGPTKTLSIAVRTP